MYTLTIMDLQGGGMGENAVNRRFFSKANALRWLREWEQDYGRHLLFNTAGISIRGLLETHKEGKWCNANEKW